MCYNEFLVAPTCSERYLSQKVKFPKPQNHYFKSPEFYRVFSSTYTFSQDFPGFLRTL